jgi:mechanosensitive ion channel-like protein
MFQDIGDSLQLAFRDALSDFFSFIPNLIGAIILLVVGWFLGKLIGGLVTKALRAVQFNKVADKAEIDTFLQNAGVKMDPAAVVGAIARWFVYLVFFLAAFNALGLPQVAAVIDDVLAFLPKVVVAIIVLLVGALAGNLLAGVVRGALRSAGVGQADLFGTVARCAVIAFAAIAALDMLEIAPTIVATLWQGLIFGIVGVLVLAFGLGGRQAASDLTLGRLLRAELEPGVEVQAGEHRGTVRTIGSLFTTLETDQGVVKVPNTQLTSQSVQMSQQAFQQQVQKRQALKEQAKQAAQSQQGGGGPRQGATAAPAGGTAVRIVPAPGAPRNDRPPRR